MRTHATTLPLYCWLLTFTEAVQDTGVYMVVYCHLGMLLHHTNTQDCMTDSSRDPGRLPIEGSIMLPALGSPLIQLPPTCFYRHCLFVSQPSLRAHQSLKDELLYCVKWTKALELSTCHSVVSADYFVVICYIMYAVTLLCLLVTLLSYHSVVSLNYPAVICYILCYIILPYLLITVLSLGYFAVICHCHTPCYIILPYLLITVLWYHSVVPADYLALVCHTMCYITQPSLLTTLWCEL